MLLNRRIVLLKHSIAPLLTAVEVNNFLNNRKMDRKNQKPALVAIR